MMLHQTMYARVPTYLNALEEANPAYHVTSIRLLRIQAFVAPQASQATARWYLPFLGLDGTHMWNTFTGTALFAVTWDANNELQPLTWAIVESKNDYSQGQFIIQLRIALPILFRELPQLTCFGQPKNIRIDISNRDKGLQNAINEFFPYAHEAFCCQHIAQNIKDRHIGAKAQKLFQKLAYAGSDATEKKARSLTDGQKALNYIDTNPAL